MNIDELDLEDLKSGVPPSNAGLLAGMTQGREDWLDLFQEYYLYNFIGRGHGSKVKVLVGSEGVGKTHLLRCVEQDARALGYAAVYLSLRDLDYRLNNLPILYRTIVGQIDKEALVRGLCRRVAECLGYGQDEYDGSGRLLPLLVEKEGWAVGDARKEIRIAIGQSFRGLDAVPAFTTFCFLATVTRLVNGQDEPLGTALRWLAGEKLALGERKATNLFETLQKSNARAWLNSLIQILNIAGMVGLVVLIDDLDEIARPMPGTRRYFYATGAVSDTHELFRQLIDDTELLNGFVLLMAGRREIVEDERRGFKSYEALWMRLQSGLLPGKHFNPYCDIVDLDLLYATKKEDFPQLVVTRLSHLLQQAGYRRHYREVPDLSGHSELRARVMEAAILMERVVD